MSGKNQSRGVCACVRECVRWRCVGRKQDGNYKFFFGRGWEILISPRQGAQSTPRTGALAMAMAAVASHDLFCDLLQGRPATADLETKLPPPPEEEDAYAQDAEFALVLGGSASAASYDEYQRQQQLVIPFSIAVTKWDVILCGVFHTEYAYLPEWVQWHVLQGVQHLVLYQNDPAPLNLAPISREYGTREFISLVDWRDEKTLAVKDRLQRAAYDHCLEHFGSHARWVLFADIDENFMPTAIAANGKTNTVAQVLMNVFEPKQASISFIATRRQDFGNKPHVEPPNKRLHMWEAFQYTAVHPNPVGAPDEKNLTKCIVNGRYAQQQRFTASAHRPEWVVAGARAVPQAPGVASPPTPLPKRLDEAGVFLLLVHYRCKSIREAEDRAKLWIQRARDQAATQVVFNAGHNKSRQGGLSYEKFNKVKDKTALNAAQAIGLERFTVCTYPLVPAERAAAPTRPPKHNPKYGSPGRGGPKKNKHQPQHNHNPRAWINRGQQYWGS